MILCILCIYDLDVIVFAVITYGALFCADTPGALFSEVVTRRSEMDMQVKMREDPLYAIR